jgi:hypothetical protein
LVGVNLGGDLKNYRDGEFSWIATIWHIQNIQKPVYKTYSKNLLIVGQIEGLIQEAYDGVYPVMPFWHDPQRNEIHKPVSPHVHRSGPHGKGIQN